MLKLRLWLTIFSIMVIYGLLIGFNLKTQNTAVHKIGRIFSPEKKQLIILWDNGIQMKNQSSAAMELITRIVEASPGQTAVFRMKEDITLIKDFKDALPDLAIYKNIGGTDLNRGIEEAARKASTEGNSQIVIISRGHNMLGTRLKAHNELAIPLTIVYFDSKPDIPLKNAVFIDYLELK